MHYDRHYRTLYTPRRTVRQLCDTPHRNTYCYETPLRLIEPTPSTHNHARCLYIQLYDTPIQLHKRQSSQCVHRLTSSPGSSSLRGHDTGSMARQPLPFIDPHPAFRRVLPPDLDPFVNCEVRPGWVSKSMERWPEGCPTDTTLTPWESPIVVEKTVKGHGHIYTEIHKSCSYVFPIYIICTI